MSDVSITIREAIPADAAEILAVMKQLSRETDFLVLDEVGMQLTPELLALNLADIYESENNLLLLALADEKIIGTASVKAAGEPSVAHIGEIGISILKAYWGIGLGSALLEEIIAWAQASGVIRRLELTVQVRNTRAVGLYQKFDFVKEGTLARGVRSAESEFLPVDLMRRLID